MTQPFSHSHNELRLEQDAGGVPLRFSLGVAAVALCYWLFVVRIEVLASSERVQLEARAASHRVQAPLDGYVSSVGARLDTWVEAGSVLVALDDSSLRSQLGELRAEETANALAQRALLREIAAIERVRERQRDVSQSHAVEATLHEQQADTLAQVAAREQVRAARLFASGAWPEVAVTRSGDAVEQSQQAADATVATRHRIEADQRLQAARDDRALVQLQREVAQLEGRAITLSARVAELTLELEKRLIRAPVSGRLGSLQRLTKGSVVRAGEELATIVPSGAVRAVALFPPEQAIGHVQVDQPCTLRLHGFPWTEFGTVRGRVERIGRDVREGLVQVELHIEQTEPSAIPLQHGLTGSVEIAVERTTPASLMLRAAGARLTAHREGT